MKTKSKTSTKVQVNRTYLCSDKKKPGDAGILVCGYTAKDAREVYSHQMGIPRSQVQARTSELSRHVSTAPAAPGPTTAPGPLSEVLGPTENVGSVVTYPRALPLGDILGPTEVVGSCPSVPSCLPNPFGEV